MSVKNKRLQRNAFLAAVFIVLLNVVAFTSGAKSNAPLLPTCKWHTEICPNTGTLREVCLVDGDGIICDCGAVSRPC